MRIGIVVQARMSSHRLPGKVLRMLGGKSLLEHLFDRLKLADGVDGLLLATSSATSDDPLQVFSEALHIPLYRGPLEDVVTRLWDAAKTFGYDAIVRISGDSPLIDPALIAQAAA